MKTLGLLGFPLTHSFSKSYFTEKFEKAGITDYQYENFSFRDIAEGVDFLKRQTGLAGFNITIPHKIDILKFLDEMSSVCEEIQSCNCVKVKDGKWSGFNTDVSGFSRSIAPLLKPHHKKALVFGSGGASKAVIFALKELGIQCQLVSRSTATGVLTYQELDAAIIGTHHILVNTTPVGMYPHAHELLPIPYDFITPEHLAYDLIYNPGETLFLSEAKKRGAEIKSGAEMLVIQAEESWRIWQEDRFV